MSFTRMFAVISAVSVVTVSTACATDATAQDDDGAIATEEGSDALRTKKFIGTWRGVPRTYSSPSSIGVGLGQAPVAAGTPVGYELRVYPDGTYAYSAYICAPDSDRCVTHPGVTPSTGTWERGSLRGNQFQIYVYSGINIPLLSRPLELTDTRNTTIRTAYSLKHDDAEGRRRIVVGVKGRTTLPDAFILSSVSDDPTFGEN